MELALTCFWQQQVAFPEVVPQLRIQSLCPNDLMFIRTDTTSTLRTFANAGAQRLAVSCAPSPRL